MCKQSQPKHTQGEAIMGYSDYNAANIEWMDADEGDSLSDEEMAVQGPPRSIMDVILQWAADGDQVEIP